MFFTAICLFVAILSVGQSCNSGNILNALNYKANANKCWIFSTTRGRYAQLRCTTFCTERYYDVLSVYDGPSPGFPAIARLSGCTSRTVVFHGRTNHFYATFNSDSSVNGRGILCFFRSTSTVFQASAQIPQLPPAPLGQNECVAIQNRFMRIINQNGECGGNQTVMEGRLEVFENGQWGGVCDNGWSDSDARVACRQLSFLEDVGTAVRGLSYNGGKGTVHRDDVRCSGDEESLSECPASLKPSASCNGQTFAGINCEDQPNVEGAIRLISFDRINQNYGRVEINHEGSWGSICGTSWADEDATVVCRSLGYDRGMAYTNAYFGEGTGNVWLSGVGCHGNEQNLMECASDPIGEVEDCDHLHDASVFCF